jgi:flagellar hook-associated protein FlgK
MTNLINYQQAYEASARVMNAIDSTLNTLIQSVGGSGM